MGALNRLNIRASAVAGAVLALATCTEPAHSQGYFAGGYAPAPTQAHPGYFADHSQQDAQNARIIADEIARQGELNRAAEARARSWERADRRHRELSRWPLPEGLEYSGY